MDGSPRRLRVGDPGGIINVVLRVERVVVVAHGVLLGGRIEQWPQCSVVPPGECGVHILFPATPGEAKVSLELF